MVFWGVSTQAKRELLHRLDAEEYSSEELVVLSIPLAVPYASQSTGYERINGEFEYDGVYYHLVKQRMENDTLFMVCIKDQHQQKLVKVMTEYSNLANNLPVNAKHTMEMFGKLFKDYTSSTFFSFIEGSCWSLDVSLAELNVALISADYPVISPPPKIG